MTSRTQVPAPEQDVISLEQQQRFRELSAELRIRRPAQAARL
jgi:hypothetical protein